MTSSLEYHVSVRHSIPASIALFTLFAFPPILVSTAQAQINGTPASVTSPGFGGRPVNGTPPSITSQGRTGSNSRAGVFPPHPPHEGNHKGEGSHHHDQYTLPSVVYPIAIPYAVDFGATNGDDNPAPDAGSTGRGEGDRDPDSVDADVRDSDSSDRENNYASRTRDDGRDLDPPQLPTLLVFKDGHKLELSNYAILGATLFDLTPGHARKVALVDLDLEATQKQNDDRGVAFQIPPPLAN